MESGIVLDLGCHGGVTKDSVCIPILHCVTGQIVSVFQKLIVPWKHCELWAQWYSITSQKLWIFRWNDFYFGISVMLGCCASSCIFAGVTNGNIYKCELIFMLRCKSLSSKRAEYGSLHWYIWDWVRDSSVLWEGTERWAWSHGLLSSHVLQPSVLLAWHKR
jgi:hypothetical protein